MKISNNTETTINVGRDIIFYSGTNQIIPMEPMHIKKEIKQIVPAYLPYLLLSFLTLNIQNGNTTEIYPIGIVIGPGITIRNMAVAGTANKKMFSELNDFNIINEEIQKGESKYGIIGIYESGFNPITVKLRK